MNLRVLCSNCFGRSLCVVLSAAMAFGPSATVMAQTPATPTTRGPAPRGSMAATPSAQPQGVASPAAAPRATTSTPTTAPASGSTRIDSTFITSDADLVVVLRPAQVMASPNAAMLPLEVASAAGLKYLGFDPAEMEEVIAFGKMPKPAVEAPVFGITVKFNKPFNGGAIPQEMRSHTERGEIAGRPYLKSTVPMMPSFYAPDSKTLVIAPEETLQKIIAHKDPAQPRPFWNRIRNAVAGNDVYAAVDLLGLRDQIKGGLALAQMQMQSQGGVTLPPEVSQFFEAPDLMNAVELTYNLSNSNASALVVHATDATGAEKLDKMVADGLKLYQEQMNAQMAMQAASEDPVEKALAAYMQRMSGGWTKMLRPERSGARLTFFRNAGNSSEQQQMTTVAVGGVLVALLLPAIQAAREAARRNQAMMGGMGQPMPMDAAMPMQNGQLQVNAVPNAGQPPVTPPGQPTQAEMDAAAAAAKKASDDFFGIKSEPVPAQQPAQPPSSDGRREVAK